MKRFIKSLVIHEDASTFVLNKPSGIPSQGGSGVARHIDGMLDGLQGNKRQRPRLVHRLDRDTSGVIVVARTLPAAAALSELLRRRDAQKIYWALTKGVPIPHRGIIKLALSKQGEEGRHERMRPAEEGDENAKSATTYYTVMGSVAYQFAWVALKPGDGANPSVARASRAYRHADRRRHQIWRLAGKGARRARRPAASARAFDRHCTPRRRPASCCRDTAASHDAYVGAVRLRSGRVLRSLRGAAPVAWPSRVTGSTRRSLSILRTGSTACCWTASR